jgi:uncharacterized glyoxalase superfamily protein PhnB
MRRPYLRSLARIADGGVATQNQCALRLHLLDKLPDQPGRAHSNLEGDTMKFQKLTPNLVVRDVTASMEFYRNVLGFQTTITVPDQAPYVFGAVTNGNVEIFFNDQKAVATDYPTLGAKPIGGSLTLFIEVEGIEDLFKQVQKHGVKITMPMKDQFYGMREFAFEDPEGWVITFAERIK